MGLFSFIAEAGKKVFSGSEKDDADKRAAVHKEIEALNLPAHLSVDIEGDKVTLSGNADSQENKEKIILAVGNLEGVAQVDENIAVSEQADKAELAKALFHQVEKGETLWKIAEKYYGNGAEYETIFTANTPPLKSADSIFPGQTLRIPQKAAAVA